MKKRLRSVNNRYRITYTILVAILIACVFLTTMSFIYSNAQNDGYESLHIQTREIKSDIEIQVTSDMENLTTIANFASKLYKNGEDFSIILKSFKPIGLIDYIGFLMPDNTIVSVAGSKDVKGILDFDTEAGKGAYVSGKEPDLTIPSKNVVRAAVPVVYEGEVVSVLYGVANLSTMAERFTPDEALGEYQLYVLDRADGDFIVDTRNNDVKNITALSSRKFVDGYTYEGFRDEVLAGDNGFSSFISKLSGEKLYIHHAPVNVGDWHIMLAMPEDSVFAEAHKIMNRMLIMLLFAVALMAIYLIIMIRMESRQAKINSSASRIRKLLLEINQQDDSIYSALNIITRYAKARSSTYVDTDGLSYNYMAYDERENRLEGKDKEFYDNRLIKYISTALTDEKMSVGVMRIELDKEMEEKDKEFYDFCKAHNIENICFAAVLGINKGVSLLVVNNCKKNKKVKELLNEIAVCFTIAMHNKKYLGQTEKVAVTDSLTGLSNRMAYKKDVKKYEDRHPEKFSCIYIDVNELHVINNRFGHAAGDSMLLYIANSLKEEFEGCSIYRMGGDEFLVFAENISVDEINAKVQNVIAKAEEKDYHISVGIDFESVNFDVEIAVKEAEKRMYEKKAEYYQKKGTQTIIEEKEQNVEHMVTGIQELDALLCILSARYVGIYSVNLKSDSPRPILIPSNFKKYQTPDARFSEVFSKYIHDMVKSDYHRPLLHFLEYDVMKRQLAENKILRTDYERITGERFRISVHLLSEEAGSVNTLWIFERM